MGMQVYGKSFEIKQYVNTKNYIKYEMKHNNIFLNIVHKKGIIKKIIFVENKDNGNIFDINYQKKLMKVDTKTYILPFFHKQLNSNFLLFYDTIQFDILQHNTRFTPLDIVIIKDKPIEVKHLKIYSNSHTNSFVLRLDDEIIELKVSSYVIY